MCLAHVARSVPRCDCLQGNHPVVDALRRAARRLAGSRVDVALHGERGSGKEHFARHLHHLVDGDAPYARIDCTEGETRIERALDALFRRPPTGGMLFIDTLEALPPHWQERLAEGLPASRGGQGGNDFRVVVSQADSYAAGCRSGVLISALQRALTPVEIAIPAGNGPS